MSVRCFVALGDSFSAGTEPGEPPWPDQLAGMLPAGRYLNLARAGARSQEIAAEQLPRALAVQPDLVSLICGANDVIRTTRPDLPAFAATFERMLATVRGRLPDATLVTATYPDMSDRSPLRPRSRARVAAGLAALNAEVRTAAPRYGAICLEFAAHPDRSQGEVLAADGFHPSPEGHRRAAQAVAEALCDQLEPKEDAA